MCGGTHATSCPTVGKLFQSLLMDPQTKKIALYLIINEFSTKTTAANPAAVNISG